MPKAKTGSKRGLAAAECWRLLQDADRPQQSRYREEEVGLDHILDSVAAQLCHERLILAIESVPRTDSPSSSPTQCICLLFLLWDQTGQCNGVVGIWICQYVSQLTGILMLWRYGIRNSFSFVCFFRYTDFVRLVEWCESWWRRQKIYMSPSSVRRSSGTRRGLYRYPAECRSGPVRR